MTNKKLAALTLLAALTAIAVACTSSKPTPTPESVPPTFVRIGITPTATPPVTPTPVPFKPILIDPGKDSLSLFDALPHDESTCLAEELGGREKAAAVVHLSYSSGLIENSKPEKVTEVIGRCISDGTTERLFVGQIALEAGGLSDATIQCMKEKIRGISAEAIFAKELGWDSAFILIKGALCLDQEERYAISTSDSALGFKDFGGIDGLECAVNGVGPTGLAELLNAAVTTEFNMAAISDHVPLLIKCGIIGDSAFEEIGLSTEQIVCLLNEVDDSAIILRIWDSTAARPELADLLAMSVAIDACGLSMEEMMESAGIPVVPDPTSVKPIEQKPKVTESPQPTSVKPIEQKPEVTETESPDNVAELAALFTDEQIVCLTNVLGEDTVAKLLAGAAPNLSMLSALPACDIDARILLGQ